MIMLNLIELLPAVTEEGAFRFFHERYCGGPLPRVGRIVKKSTPLEKTGWSFADAWRALMLREGRDQGGKPYSQRAISRIIGMGHGTVADLFIRVDLAEAARLSRPGGQIQHDNLRRDVESDEVAQGES
jgi:hypothetical protein